jgi:NAD+ kinase
MSLRVALRGDVSLADLSGASEDVVAADGEATADLVVAAGERAIRSLVDAPAPVPVLPLDADVGPYGVTADGVAGCLRTLATDPSPVTDRVVRHPLLSVTVDGFRTEAVLDAALVTSEAARISEYTVADRVGDLASFRADGVVVATPAGSAGYSHAAGGPVLTTEAGLAVVPISPYTTRPSTWVVDAPIELGIERDETPVSLVVDGTVRRQVGVDDAIEVAVAGHVDLVRPPSSADGARRLEKL